ncbi:MAG TPA: hypothetical protein VFN76_09835 [Candidatus Limnocylindria bacterium]|nr:hypothetical protein [Candidatus Limnocylindria bacterium]
MWIRIDTDIGMNTKTLVLRTSCGLSTPEAVGVLVMLFSRLADNGSDGDVSQLPDAVLEEWAAWRGEPGLFARSFREQFVRDGVITGWHRQTKLIEQHARDAARKRDARARRTSRGASIGRPADAARTSEPSPAVTVTNNDDDNDVVCSLPDRAREESAGGEPVAPAPLDDPPRLSDVARLLAITANQAITRRWGEQTRPIVATSGSSHSAAADLIAAGVPVEFARESIVGQVDASRRTSPPGHLSWFVPGIRQDWDSHLAHADARSAPGIGPVPPRPSPAGARGPRASGKATGADVFAASLAGADMVIGAAEAAARARASPDTPYRDEVSRGALGTGGEPEG